MPILVHHLASSRSLRILWLLEELQLPYEVRRYERDPRTWRAPPELRAVHPLGKAPALEVDGQVWVETGAIVEGLIDRAGGALRPTEPDALHTFRFWLHYAEGSLLPPLLVQLITDRIRRGPRLARPLLGAIADKVDGAYTTAEIALHLGFVESQLTGREWLLGDRFSAADVVMSYPLEAAEDRAGLGDYPSIRAWLERAHARAAYQAAVTRGAP